MNGGKSHFPILVAMGEQQGSQWFHKIFFWVFFWSDFFALTWSSFWIFFSLSLLTVSSTIWSHIVLSLSIGKTSICKWTIDCTCSLVTNKFDWKFLGAMYLNIHKGKHNSILFLIALLLASDIPDLLSLTCLHFSFVYLFYRFRKVFLTISSKFKETIWRRNLLLKYCRTAKKVNLALL